MISALKKSSGSMSTLSKVECMQQTDSNPPAACSDTANSSRKNPPLPSINKADSQNSCGNQPIIFDLKASAT